MRLDARHQLVEQALGGKAGADGTARPRSLRKALGPADVAGADQRVDGLVHASASGMTIMWFLAPPKTGHQFAVGAGAGIDVLRDRGS